MESYPASEAVAPSPGLPWQLKQVVCVKFDDYVLQGQAEDDLEQKVLFAHEERN